ncbi:MAG: reverse transcriptase domain-containing protein, partial [Planctomycetota bacterium]
MSIGNFLDSSRPYNFAEHGRSDHWANHQQIRRVTRATVSEVRPPAPDRPLTRQNVAHADKLLEAFKVLKDENGQSPGGDGIRYDDFGLSEIARALRVISAEITRNEYRPQPHREVPIPREGRLPRQLRLRTVLDRTVSKAILIALTPRIDPSFLPGSFAYRPQRSVHHLLAAMARGAKEAGSWWFVQDDIRDAFPSIRIEDALAGFRRYVADPELMQLISVVLQGHDANRTVGIDQGDPISPLALNLVLHEVIDVPLDAAMGRQSLWFRFSDNVAIVCQTRSECAEKLALLANWLGVHGLVLKGENSRPVNFQRIGAHAEFLGFDIRKTGNRLSFGVGPEAWSKLRSYLNGIWKKSDPSEMAKLIISGWINSYGPALGHETRAESFALIRELAREVHIREGLSNDNLMMWL